MNRILSITPDCGTPLGNNTFKIRIAIKSKGKGKSGGGRIITYLISEDKTIFLLTIYDKSYIDAVDDVTISEIIKGLFENS